MRVLYLFAVYVHIVTAAVWVGAMLFEDPASHRFMSRLVNKIHGIGGPCLVLLIGTGAFFLYLRGVALQELLSGRFFANAYGQVLGVKLLLVLFLIVLQITVGHRPSRLLYAYLLTALVVIALSVWLVRPIL